MQHLALDSGRIKAASHNPRWIIRECRACGGHPIPFEAGGWEAVFGFVLQGWSAMRDGDAVRIWFADQQEGSA